MEYEKGQGTNLSLHFSSLDFDCRCTDKACETTRIEPLLIECLEVFWKLSGGLIVTSGYRCEAHNRVVGGAVDSQHLLGKAADCKSKKGYNGNFMAQLAEQILPFDRGGIGIYPTFCHVDIRMGKARWSRPRDC